MSFIAPKNKLAGLMTCYKPFAISANTKRRQRTLNISKRIFGRKNKITSALGKPGWHSMPKWQRINDQLLRERGLGGGESSDRDSERTATNVIEPQPVTEFHAVRFAAVLATNPKFNLGTGLAAEIACHFHQSADAPLVDRS